MKQTYTEAKDDGEIIQVKRDDDGKYFNVRHIDYCGNVRNLDYLKRPIVISLIKNLALAVGIDILMRGSRGHFVKPEDFRE
jgi:hypothetical protein